MNACELARKMATKAPEGARLGGPGTRSKNPVRFDRHSKAKKKELSDESIST